MKRFFSSKVRTVLVIAVVLAAALTVIGNLTGSTPLDGGQPPEKRCGPVVQLPVPL